MNTFLSGRTVFTTDKATRKELLPYTVKERYLQAGHWKHVCESENSKDKAVFREQDIQGENEAFARLMTLLDDLKRTETYVEFKYDNHQFHLNAYGEAFVFDEETSAWTPTMIAKNDHPPAADTIDHFKKKIADALKTSAEEVEARIGGECDHGSWTETIRRYN